MPPISYKISHSEAYGLFCRILAKFENIDIRHLYDSEIFNRVSKPYSNQAKCLPVFNEIDKESPSSKEFYNLGYAVRHFQSYYTTDRTLLLYEKYIDNPIYKIKKELVEDWSPTKELSGLVGRKFWVYTLVRGINRYFPFPKRRILRSSITFKPFNKVAMIAPGEFYNPLKGGDLELEGEYYFAPHSKDILTIKLEQPNSENSTVIEVFMGKVVDSTLDLEEFVFEEFPILIGYSYSKTSRTFISQLTIFRSYYDHEGKPAIMKDYPLEKSYPRDTDAIVQIFFKRETPTSMLPFGITNDKSLNDYIKKLEKKPLLLNPIERFFRWLDYINDKYWD